MAQEAAIAHLTVLGTRAVERLTTVAGDARRGPAVRAAALRALTAIGDLRGLDVALQSIDDKDATVAIAAVELARLFLSSKRGVAAVDRLAAAALDRQRGLPLRVAAIRALTDLEASSVGPLFDTLRNDPAAEIAALANVSRDREPHPDPDGVLDAALEGTLPEDPSLLRPALARAAPDLPLAQLHRLIERLRAQEEDAEPPARRAEWMVARAAAHVALANRGSRLAVYDLRETLEQATGTLPVEFLAALTAIGDASCLGAIAAAYAKSAGATRGRDDWWRRHLAAAFRAIAARHRMTRRHAVIKNIQRRWGALVEPLIG